MPSLSFEVFSREHERARLGESPCWDPETNDLWWVDVTGKRLLRTDLGSGQTKGWPMPELVGFVVMMGPDAPAVGMETGIYAFAPRAGTFDRLVRFDEAGCRFNDATVDASGRLWASTMELDGQPGRAAIHLVTQRLELEPVVSGLATPNGLAVDLERGRAFHSDSHPDVQSIWEMPIEDGSGQTGEPHPFASTAELRGRPDGAALTQDGSYWIAGVDGGELYVYGLDGVLGAAVPVPFPAPTKVCFAGQDDQLIVVTSKGIGESGGYLARARMPRGMSPGTVQPYWIPGAP